MAPIGGIGTAQANFLPIFLSGRRPTFTQASTSQPWVKARAQYNIRYNHRRPACPKSAITFDFPFPRIADLGQAGPRYGSTQRVMKKRVLILCTGNSCRSQMAEFLWNRLGGDDWTAESAGSRPAGYVHPLAIKAMQDLGEDLSQAQSKHVDQFLQQPIDLAVTVCDSAKESCPVMPAVKQTLHWPFFDPADAVGTDEEKLQVFRQVRDQIHAKIEAYLQAEG